ncbi:MAG: molecular chaperone HtpG, partial [Solobacterium sp.]|nr:molecular chaperone HtpG [Solobacterium sp.]
DDPVCLVSDEGLSIEMEKILAQQDPAGRSMKAEKILEINPDHPIFATLQNVYKNSPEELKEFTDVLYDQALLIEGLPLDDPAAYARKIVSMMIQAADRK